MDGAMDTIPAVILVLVGNAIAKWNYTCPSETSSLTNGSESAVWRSRGIDNEIVVSMPPCVDRSDALVTRICRGGVWIPRNVPRCHHFFVEGERETDFRPECEEEQPSSYGVRWLPYERKIGYGPYESVVRDEWYGTPLEDNLTYAVSFLRNELFKKNCLLESYVTLQIFPEFCVRQTPNYCQKTKTIEECPGNCVEGDKQTCFCKTWRGNCEKLAGIRTYSDRKTIVDLLEDEDECRLANSQTLSKYSWLYSDKESRCWICETSPVTKTLPETAMVLNFDDRSKELHLTMYNPQGLYHRGHQDLVYCFTDASKRLRKRVKVRTLFKHFGDDIFFVYGLKLEDYIGNYWCESYRTVEQGDPVTSNKVLAYKKKNGNEYSLRLEIRDPCKLFDCPEKKLYVPFEDFIPKNVTGAFEGIGLKVELRVMEVFYFDFELLDVLIHVTTLRRRAVQEEFAAMQEELAKIDGQITVLFFRSSEYCVKETTVSGSSLVTWPSTRIGRAVTTDEICLQVNGFPVYRTCGGEFMYGSKWRDANGDCQPIEPTDCTKYIHSVASRNISEVVLANVTELIGRERQLSVLDVYYLARILRHVVDEQEAAAATLLDLSMTLIDELLRVDPATLSEAQQMLNSTDDIIDTVQELLSRHFRALMLHRKNLLVHVTMPRVSNVTGVVVYRENDSYVAGDFLRGTTLADAEKIEGFYFAVHVPDAQLAEWENLNYSSYPHELMVITTIYFNDRFFSNAAKNVSGPIVDVVVPGFGNFLQKPIPIWYKAQSDGAQESPECAFWDYGKKTGRHKGYWSSLGGSYKGTDNVVHVCEFMHLTHFALLVSKMVINKTDENALDLIILIGDSLTLLGISGIFLTAFLFETWRRKQGTKILLNLCISIVGEVILMLVLQSDLIATTKRCKIWGPLLHYFVLSKFCWMLVYAFLQHMRFVKVLGAIPSNIVLKSSFFGWGFPLLPVLSVCFIETYRYDLSNYLLCYPQGLPLYLGLIAPIILIILINTVVFAVVMRHVTAKTAEVHTKSSDVTTNKLQIQLATLLFFVLGLPMIFGLLCNLVPISWFRTVLIYLFALTSNVQGLVLFVFYVLLNKETRGKWVKYFGGRQKLISSSSSSRSKL